MKKVAILGLGLMGGSLGLALKARRPGLCVAGYARRAESRGRAIRHGVVDEVFETPASAVARADLVILCTPILSMPELLKEALPGLAPGSLVSDVGSTKAWLAETLPAGLQGTGAAFIGSHPIAGSEQQGLDAARPDLYEGAAVILTPVPATPASPVEALRAFWEAVGGRVHVMTPARHDEIMARTSHLPHLAAAALAAVVGRGGNPRVWGPFCGTGFADSTRIAEGSPEVWHDILRTNAGPVREECRALASEMEKLSGLMERGQFDIIRQFLEETRERRRALLQERGGDNRGQENT